MSPFKSKAQMKYMFANMPATAKKWAAVTANIKDLPTRKITAKGRGKKKKLLNKGKTIFGG